MCKQQSSVDNKYETAQLVYCDYMGYRQEKIEIEGDILDHIQRIEMTAEMKKDCMKSEKNALALSELL